MSTKRSVLLDLLRICAIGLVFIAHIGQFLHPFEGHFFGVKNFYYVTLGGVGVSLFLLLSGILAGLGGYSQKTTYIPFMMKKISRIYPSYLLSLPLAVLALYFAEGHMPHMFPNGFWRDTVGSLTGFYSWMGLWGGPFNAATWFIGLIMTLYALFPLLFKAMEKAPHLTLGILFCISFSTRYYVGQHGVPFVDTSVWEDVQGWGYRFFGFMPGRPVDWFPLCRVFEFGLGVYLALCVPRRFWFGLKIGFLSRPLYQLSDLAFPLFLVHMPFLFLIDTFKGFGLPEMYAIGAFFFVVTVFAYGIHYLDKKIPRIKK